MKEKNILLKEKNNCEPYLEARRVTTLMIGTVELEKMLPSILYCLTHDEN